MHVDRTISLLRGISSSARGGRTCTWLLLLVLLSTGCASPARDTAPPARKRLSFSVLEDYDKGDDLAQVGRDFDLMAELGVHVWRGSFGWDDYEPEPGAYDFDWLHRFAELADARGITLRPYIGYTPEWAATGGGDGDAWNDPPADLDSWFRFVTTLAREMRRHRNIASYEIYNEENAPQWWDGTPARYRQVLRRGIDAVKAGNPDVQVLLGGMVFADVDWIERVCEGDDSGDRVDVLPFHAYPETWTPAGVTVETYLGADFASGFVAAADAACGRKPLWINETGYATTPGRTEADQAQWWLRAVATFASEPRIEHIGIYEIKDLPKDRDAIGDAPNYHLGLTNAQRRRKLAFGTVKRLVSLLGTEPFTAQAPRVITARDDAGTGIYRHLFIRGDGHRVLFLWTHAAAATVDAEIGGAAGYAAEYAADGGIAGQVPLADGWLRGITLRRGVVRTFAADR